MLPGDAAAPGGAAAPAPGDVASSRTGRDEVVAEERVTDTNYNIYDAINDPLA